MAYINILVTTFVKIACHRWKETTLKSVCIALIERKVAATAQLSAVRAQPRLGDEAGQLRGTVLSYFLENIQAEALSVIQ